MSDDRRDEIVSWLSQEVGLLPPRPGTFEQVRKRARRRRLGRAAAAGAGAAVLIAGGALAPQIVSAVRQSGSRHHGAVAFASPKPSSRVASSPPASPPATAVPGKPGSRTATPLPDGTSLSTTTSGTPVPPGFEPTSVTMIAGNVGAVIGQAGSPGHCETRYCTSLAGTSNYGGSWYGVSAPETGGPDAADGGSGVSQLRLLDLRYGWAFGPQLWATSDGGASWQQAATGGQRVTALETAQGRAFAVLAKCSGGTAGDYAADCTSFSLYSSAAGSSQWQPVPGPVQDLRSRAGRPASASLIIASSTAADPQSPTGYLLAPSGQLLSGPLTGGAWKVAGQIPAACTPGTGSLSGGQLSGQQLGAQQPTAQLASGSAASGSPAEVAAGSQLLLSCNAARADGSPRAQVKTIYMSAGGATWHLVGNAPAAGIADSLAASSGGLVVLATTTGIDYSADGGRHWKQAVIRGAPAATGFTYVGMTTPQQGVAVPADSGLDEIFTTADGGQTWSASAVAGTGS
jgi:hypothetical protein